MSNDEAVEAHSRVEEIRNWIRYRVKSIVTLQRHQASSFQSIENERDHLARLQAELVLAEARAAETGPACPHLQTKRGKDYPLRFGSYRTNVCVACGAWRTHGHNDKDYDYWQPTSSYEEETRPREEDEE